MGDEILLKEIGVRINRRRRELFMTQENLAEAMDVSIQMISNLELGKKAIRPENLVKICQALNISADYVLCGARPIPRTSDFFDKYNSLSKEKQELLIALVNSWTE